jgi:hypothetical protein
MRVVVVAVTPPRRGVGEREGIPLPGRNQTADADRGNNPRDVITV